MECDDLNVRRGGTEIGAAPCRLRRAVDRSVHESFAREHAATGGIAGAYETCRCREILAHRLIEGSVGRSPNGPHNVRATCAAHNGEPPVAFRLPRQVVMKESSTLVTWDGRERRAQHGITKRRSKQRSDQRTRERWRQQHEQFSPNHIGWTPQWIEQRQ